VRVVRGFLKAAILSATLANVGLVNATPPSPPPFATPGSVGAVITRVPVAIAPNLDVEGTSLKSGRTVRFSLLLQVTKPEVLLRGKASSGAMCQLTAEGLKSPSTPRIEIQPEWLSCYDSHGNTLADVNVTGYLLGVDNKSGLPAARDLKPGSTGIAVLKAPVMTGQKGTAQPVGD
jgi:hypothetical protein